ncbi:MAG: beta-galactosidase [Armatimonadota bacterium]
MIPYLKIISTIMLTSLICTVGSAQPQRASVLRANFPGEDLVLIEAVKSQLKSAGYDISEIDDKYLCDSSSLTTKNIDLLVLTNASALPMSSTGAIDAFLREGGDLIALNTPMWQKPLIKMGSAWVDKETYLRQRAGMLPEHVLFRFTPEDLSGWERGTGDDRYVTTYESTADGPALGLNSLHVVASNLQAWDGYSSPDIKSPFKPGDTLTVLSAKGGPRTSKLSVEWSEKDGSRWIAVIPLSAEWRQYVLRPADFKYWKSNPARGENGDSFRPENAERVSIGLSYTHTSNTNGRHEYWVGPLGTAADNADYTQVHDIMDPMPVMDTLTPFYKLFRMNDVASLNIQSDQTMVEPVKLSTPATMRSPLPRPGGAGFDKGRDWRWIPLIEGSTADGEWRGNPATLMVHASGPYKGGAWASFGVDDQAWYRSPEALNLIGQAAKRMRQGAFILDGGTDFYTYFKDQSIRVGANITNITGDPFDNMQVKAVIEESRTHKVVKSYEWPLSLKPGEKGAVSDSLKPSTWPAGGFIVTVDLLHNGQVIDRVSHDINFWEPKKRKEFITYKDGEFMLKGKRWRAHGVNYMPSSGIGAEDPDYFHYWLEAASYDPEVIERDLAHIKDMGMNSVSIFLFHRSIESQNLLDLLRRLDAYGIKANLSIRPWYPMTDLHEMWPKMKEIIERYRIKDNDTVFAYDIDWEPTWSTRAHRANWDKQWEQWIIERYGSVRNAEKDWGFPAPRDENGKIGNPPPGNFDVDGEWRRMSAAYRRFLDTLLYQHYGTARRLIKSIDPNHPVSFRMHAAGTATCEWWEHVAYDFPYLGSAVDIFEPEAYALTPDEESIKTGRFTREYARWASPDKPLFWAEVGQSLTEGSGDTDPSPDRYKAQADLYERFYRMLTSSGTNGIFFWWYPGGFRYGENSDYGIINPDGSDRLVTKVIKAWSDKYLNGPTIKPDMYIEIDRDAYTKSNGIAGVYTMVKDQFWAAIEKGQNPGLKTVGTGKNSATCPLLAIGNTPCNGSNPPKYLDAAIDRVDVLNADGKWVTVANGGSVTVRPGAPVKSMVYLTNLGEAKWLSRSTGAGNVYVTVNKGIDTLRTGLSKDVRQSQSVRVEAVLSDGMQSASGDVTISMLAEGRTPFGPKFKVNLVPKR